MDKKIFLSLFFLGLLIAGPVLAQQVQLVNPLSAGDIPTLLGNIIRAVGGLIAALGTIMIIVAGILYLTSAGSAERMTKAKTALIYAIAGIVIGTIAYVLPPMIIGILNGTP